MSQFLLMYPTSPQYIPLAIPLTGLTTLVRTQSLPQQQAQRSHLPYPQRSKETMNHRYHAMAKALEKSLKVATDKTTDKTIEKTTIKAILRWSFQGCLMLLLAWNGLTASLEAAGTSTKTCFANKITDENAPPQSATGDFGTRIFLDHDHANIGFGSIFSNAGKSSAFIPYVGAGYSFFAGGLSWEGGAQYCYKNYSIRAGYEGKYAVAPSDTPDEDDLIHTSYLTQEFLFGNYLLSLIYKYGQSWEYQRLTEGDNPIYGRRAFETFEAVLISSVPLITTPRFKMSLYEYTAYAYLTELDISTVNSLLVFDNTFLETLWGETKWILSFVHTYSSNKSEILERRSMFFISPYPLDRSDQAFYDEVTAGYLAGTVAFGERFFLSPKKSVKDDNGEIMKKGLYLAPYAIWGWGLAHTEENDVFSSAFSLALYFGYKLPLDRGTASVAFGWNNKEGYAISLLSSF